MDHYVMDPTTHAKLGFQGPNVSISSFYIFYVLAQLHRSHCRS